MERLGKYEIISEIGRGAMGAVYKARDPFIERLVALKTITSNVGAQANALERFYQEARSAGTLQHPHIVTIYELGHEGNTPFIAMEYIEGESLDRIIEQRKPLPLSVKLGYMVRVCDALSYAHSHNVVHRDIKPGNIMVTKEGVVKVVDFGIARLTDMSLTQPNMMIGSRAYMSPQLYKGERADARADIWAVGITLYELIAYQRPFDGASEAELMFRILSDPPPPLQLTDEACAQELTQIISHMLEKKAEERYQSMEDVVRDFEPLWKTAQQSTVAGLLADSQQLVAANDLQRAQGLLRKALQIDFGNSRVKTLLEKVTSELRRSQVLPKVNEHVERGRSLLQSGKIGEAKAEVQAALGLDSRHDQAQALFSQVEAAAARAQEVEQKLRLTKQRLAEGALTEAAAALGAALDLDSANSQAKELRRQIEEERNRRERRKKLSEVLHHARTLWTALDYDGCLRTIVEALKEFPEDPELLKLQEMARHDLEDLDKQRQLGEARKLLGQLEFAGARKIIDGLVAKYPQDSAVKNLQTLVLDAEREQQKSKRFIDELAHLRGLLSRGKFADAVTRGNTLLREFPEEFELKELLDYARGEQAQQELRQKEKNYEVQIQELMEAEKYREAEALARRAAQDFPKMELFRSLLDEAAQKCQAQEKRERNRQEMLKRIREIDKHMQKEKISDAIKLAELTLNQMGPDPEVTRRLNAAKQLEQREQKQQEQFAAAQTMVDAGNFAAATQVLNQAMAAQIFEPSDRRVKERLREIEQLSESSGAIAAVRPAGQPPAEQASATMAFSATMAAGAAASPARARADAATSVQSQSRPAAEMIAPPARTASTTGTSAVKPRGTEKTSQFAETASRLLQNAAVAARKPAVFGSVAAVAVIVAVTIVILHPPKGSAKNSNEAALRERAAQLWSSHDLDGSVQAWQQLQQMHGGLEKEAAQQLSDIQDKRAKEQQLFDQAMSVKAQDAATAKQEFQQVQDMNLWHVEDAQKELAVLSLPPVDPNAGKADEEKAHFARGEQLFQSKNYDLARKEFLAIRDLNLPDSAVRPEAEKYLKRIKQTVDDKNLFDAAMQDLKGENWADARSKFQQVVAHKASMSADANQKLAEVAEAEKSQDDFGKALQAGNYRNAKAVVDAVPWPKTQSSLRAKLQASQKRQFDEYESTWATVQQNKETAAAEHLQDEVRKFANRAEDGTLVQSANDLDKKIAFTAGKWREEQGDKAAFDAAVSAFFAAKQKRDTNMLAREVLPKFQKFAQSPGLYHDQAQTYVTRTIPATIAELKGSPKLFLPPLSCSGTGPSAPTDPSLSSVTCAQLDPGAPLQWSDTYSVDFPESASQSGKLPYTLKLIVVVDPTGKVKVDKDGNVDKDFLKKAKDASKNWKTSIPKSGGKPVTVRFPLSITFQH